MSADPVGERYAEMTRQSREFWKAVGPTLSYYRPAHKDDFLIHWIHEHPYGLVHLYAQLEANGCTGYL